MSQDRPPTLFVSHPSTKAETAGHIEKALNLRGVHCWIAPRDVEPGEQWDVSIRRAIAETDAMLLLFCGDSERSRQVKRELILADQSNKPIIPIRLERIEPIELSYHLADSQWIDWIEQRDEAIDRIAAKAREFHGQEQLGREHFVPKPPAPPPAQPGKSNAWIWWLVGSIFVVGMAALLIWVAMRDSRQTIDEAWFAGTWSDTRDCETFFRFDAGGSLTSSEGTQGTWYLENGNTLVIELLGRTERRQLTKVNESEVSSPSGNAYRCF